MTNHENTEETAVPAAADAEAGITDAEPDFSEIEVRNPRIGRVRRLQEEAKRERGIERARSRRIRQEQEYIDQMSLEIEENLRNTKEEQKYNEEFEEHIRGEVYRMHGIGADKLQGMTEYRRAWYQGAAFALFFLSVLLYMLCGALHGFGAEISIFMALYTALGGALLNHGQKRSACMTVFTRGIYLCLFPVMMVVFVCYELGFEEYGRLVPVCTAAAVVILLAGSASYFLYDPYRADRRNRKKADRYLRGMEKAAAKEVRLKEKAYGKQEKREARKKARQRENPLAFQRENPLAFQRENPLAFQEAKEQEADPLAFQEAKEQEQEAKAGGRTPWWKAGLAGRLFNRRKDAGADQKGGRSEEEAAGDPPDVECVPPPEEEEAAGNPPDVESVPSPEAEAVAGDPFPEEEEAAGNPPDVESVPPPEEEAVAGDPLLEEIHEADLQEARPGDDIQQKGST